VIAAGFASAGIALIDRLPDGARSLAGLRSAEGETLDAQTHATCPGHLAVMMTRSADVSYGCADFKTHGHRDIYSYSSRPTVPAQDRGVTVEGNRAHDAAEKVRREWLTALFSRSTVNAKTGEALARFVAETYAVCPEPMEFAVGKPKTRAIQAAILGMPETKPEDLAQALAQFARSAAKARLPLIGASLAAAAYELRFGRDVWRTDAEYAGKWHIERRQDIARWLRFCVELGYTPAPVELAIIEGQGYDPLKAESYPLSSQTDDDQDEEDEEGYAEDDDEFEDDDQDDTE